MNELLIIRAEVAKMSLSQLMAPVTCACCKTVIEPGLGVREGDDDFCDMDCSVR